MSKLVRPGLLAACLVWAAATFAEQPDLHLGGLLFGDLYSIPSNHLENGDGAAGLVLRRGYFTLDAELSRTWFGRARLEVNQSGKFETYTFTSRLKDLYIGWKPGRQQILFGLSPTPTFDLVESIWGFRYLARTPMDLQGVPSRETGISAKGPLNPSGSLSYRAMWADNQKVMAALTWKPAPPWTVDFYTDYQWLPGPTDRQTLQIFLAYETDRLRWGAQYSNQNRQQDPPLKLASFFINVDTGENTALVGRIDRLFEPSPEGNNIAYLPFDPTARATTFFGGMEFRVNPHFSVTPNTVVTRYDRNDQGVRPKTDVYLRLTLLLNFE